MIEIPAVPEPFEITAALNRALFAQAAASSAAVTLAQEEVKLKEAMAALETLMQKHNLRTVGSTLGSADFVPQVLYRPADWRPIYAHIQKTGEFDLLHKRLSQTALRDRDSNNELPDGVQRATIHKLALTVK